MSTTEKTPAVPDPAAPKTAVSGAVDAAAAPTATTPRSRRKRSEITLVKEAHTHSGGERLSESVANGEIVKGLTTTRSTSLCWEAPPGAILICTRRGDQQVQLKMIELGTWLKNTYHSTILVEPHVRNEINQFETWTEDELETLHDKVDLIISMGGDGTLMHVGSLFPRAHPPVLAFNFGSMGFLTPFDFENYATQIPQIFKNSHVTLRSRLHCVVDHVDPTRHTKPYQVLNEIVVDRGLSPYLSQIDCFCNDRFITTVQADGVIIATATGSTAYSVSAGGSIMHPEVPGILFTPICPHSLSFRPIVFPDSVVLKLQIPTTFQGRARCTMDGHAGATLAPGDSVLIQISRYPVPCLAQDDHTVEWMRSLADCLHWNTRVKQRGVEPDLQRRQSVDCALERTSSRSARTPPPSLPRNYSTEHFQQLEKTHVQDSDQ